MQVIPEIGDYRYFPGHYNNREYLMKLADTRTLYYPKSGKEYKRYLFENMLDCIARDMRARITNHYDNMVMVNGKVGTGKSNNAYALAHKFDPHFDYEDGLIWDWEQLIDKAADGEIKSGKVYILDEGTRVSNNRKGMTKSGRNFIEYLETNRFKEASYIYIIPKYARSDSYLKSDRVTHRMVTKVMAWDHRKVSSRGYFLYKYPLDDMDDDSTDGIVFRNGGYGMFEEMPAEVKAFYDKIKDRNIDEQNQAMREEYRAEKEKERKDPDASNLLIWNLYKEGKDAYEIAEASGLAVGTIRNKLVQLRRKYGTAEEDGEEDDA